jgi:serine protease Do
VSIQPLTKPLAQSFQRSDARGALVSRVIEGSPAEKAGVKAGDVIVALDGKTVDKIEDLPRLVAEMHAGREVRLTVVRDGKEQTLTATIAKLDEEAPSKVAQAEGKSRLGLSVQPVTPPVASELRLKVKEGVLVRDVVEGSRADEAGIRPGDVIVEVDRQPVRSVEELQAHVNRHSKGESVLMLVNRDGNTVYVAVPAA